MLLRYQFGCRLLHSLRILVARNNTINTRSTNNYCTESQEPQPSQPGQTFEELLRSSPFMKIDRFEGQTVVGKIVNVCGRDLYIDYGGKFEVVIQAPENKLSFYKEGGFVQLVLKKQELTGHFLGQRKRITLLEADAELLGPYSLNSNLRERKVR